MDIFGCKNIKRLGETRNRGEMERAKEMEAGENTDFNALPQGCTEKILSLTTPEDVCRLSKVSTDFRSAGNSDLVWEKFLPSDYRDIISRATDPSSLPVFSSKKALYLSLCDAPLLIDAGKKRFSLEKHTGKKCYMLAARDLKIVWGDTPEYWTWTSLPEARFEEVAQLLLVWWLEIHGNISTSLLSPHTTYEAYVVFKLKSAYGFRDAPAKVSFGIVGEESEAQVQYVYLDPKRREHGQHSSWREQNPGIEESDIQYAKRREDGWLEVELGEFINDKDEDDDLEMRLMEVSGITSKCGLIVEGIEIRPKGIA